MIFHEYLLVLDHAFIIKRENQTETGVRLHPGIERKHASLERFRIIGRKKFFYWVFFG